MSIRMILISLAAICTGTIAAAHPADTGITAPEKPVEILFLGTYHFGNPGQDVNNLEADDVLSDRRQEELARLSAALAEFQPTKVAVERTADTSEFLDPTYAQFTAERLLEVRNERVQIGHRLANLAGLDRVYAVDEQPQGDEPDYFPYGSVTEFMDQRGRGDEIAQLNGSIQAAMGQFKRMEPVLSIGELLLAMNNGLFPQHFYQQIMLIGEGEDQPGPELAAYWYMRNAKIFNKIAQISEPGDRIVVIYGQGHAAWLQHMIAEAPGFVLVDARPYLEAAR